MQSMKVEIEEYQRRFQQIKTMLRVRCLCVMLIKKDADNSAVLVTVLYAMYAQCFRRTARTPAA